MSTITRSVTKGFPPEVSKEGPDQLYRLRVLGGTWTLSLTEPPSRVLRRKSVRGRSLNLRVTGFWTLTPAVWSP